MATFEQLPYVDAELYDLVFSWYRFDVDFYVQTARDARGPVLEVGCGTGRILLPTLEAGVDIQGIDLSESMLAVLRRKAAERGLTPRVTRADMRDFTMPRRYRLVTIPFRAFMHNLTTGDQLATLRCCREHLEPGGALVFNLFHPSFDMIVNRGGDEMRLERTFTDPDTGHTVSLHSRQRYDRVNQILNSEREVHRSDPQGSAATVYRYGFTIRWLYRAEMELLLRAAGFMRFDVRGGFEGQPLEKDTDEMVWTAWKD